MIREAIAHVTAGATLSTNQAAEAMEEIMTGVATPAQMGAFLTALRLRPGGETVAEITGMAQVMREKALRVHLNEETAPRALEYLRHRWRRVRHIQYLNSRRRCRRSGWRYRCKTWQSFSYERMWERRCIRSAGGQD